jgi:hypothetical protein
MRKCDVEREQACIVRLWNQPKNVIKKSDELFAMMDLENTE